MNRFITSPPTGTSAYSLPASLLRQYAFCQRIPWFNEVRKLNPSDRKWQAQGIDYHSRQTMLTKRRKLTQFGFEGAKIEFNVHLKHSSGIHGVADAILFAEEKLTVVEFKLGSTAPTRGQILQVLAYGVMAKEQFSLPCKSVFLCVGDKGKTYEKKLDERNISLLNQSLYGLKKSLHLPIMPDSSASTAQCAQCEYFNFCGDRE